MLVGRVRVDLVDDDPEPERVRALEQPIEILECPEDRVDAAVVGHVIAEVAHRRGEERAQPDRIHPEGGHVGQMRGDAREIADPIAVRVGEAARVDLIDARPAPPFPPGIEAAELSVPCAHRPVPEAHTM